MLGLAQKLFLDRTGKCPWKIEAKENALPWAFLDTLLEWGHLPYIDYIIAKRLAEDQAYASEEAAALICHLSQATRLGHLCIKIVGKNIFPTVDEVWDLALDESQSEVRLALDERWMSALNERILRGVDALSTSIEDADSISTTDLSSKFPVCRRGNDFYFQGNWTLETLFIKHFSMFLANRISSYALDSENIEEKVDTLLQNGLLLEEQGFAIKHAAVQNFTIISGGPGTGKTYTAGMLLKSFLSTSQQAADCRIVLAAPTGKAAAHLEASIKRGLDGVLNKYSISAKTLHALLYRPRSFYPRAPECISADILLVDECSMIDVKMMGKLMAALQKGTKLIMLGDPDQLPAIEGGSLFADMIGYFQSGYGGFNPVVELTRCLRAESKEILQFAQAIKSGDSEKLLQTLALSHSSYEKAISFYPQDQIEMREIQKKLFRETLLRFPRLQELPQNPLELLQKFTSFRILTPSRSGPLGVEELNAGFYERFYARSRQEKWFIAPIIITKNDYRWELFNGEMGLLIHSFKNEPEYAIFSGREGGDARKVPAALLPQFEFAYALSIHKSQGSEFHSVLLLLPEGCERFGREAFYTGATRARSSLEVWSDLHTMRQLLLKGSRRQSGVQVRLQQQLVNTEGIAYR